jgi:FkbM family methyltransferase
MNTTNIQIGNVVVQLFDDGDRIVGVTKRGKEWEKKTCAVWPRLVEPGTVMVDVGAYNGIYAIASAMMGAKVIAFEPHPANFARMKANASLNSVRIEMVKAALSDREGTTSLYMKHSEDRMSDLGSLELMPSIDAHGITVQTQRLDIIKFTARVGLIKIDVEGHEMPVLNGAAQTIFDYHPNVVIEVLSEQAAADVSRFMEAQCYGKPIVMDVRNRLYAREI